MTVIEEYADTIRRLEAIKYQSRFRRRHPDLGFVMLNTIQAITVLAERCQAAEDAMREFNSRGMNPEKNFTRY